MLALKRFISQARSRNGIWNLNGPQQRCGLCQFRGFTLLSSCGIAQHPGMELRGTLDLHSAELVLRMRALTCWLYENCLRLHTTSCIEIQCWAQKYLESMSWSVIVMSYEYCGERTQRFWDRCKTGHHYCVLALIWWATYDIYGRLLVSKLVVWLVSCGIQWVSHCSAALRCYEANAGEMNIKYSTVPPFADPEAVFSVECKPELSTVSGPFGDWVAGPFGDWVAGPFGDRVAGPFGDWVAGPFGDRVAGLFGDRVAGPFRDWVVAGCGSVTTPFGDWVAGPFGDRVAGPFGDWVAGPFGDWVVAGCGSVTTPFGDWVAGPFGDWVAGPFLGWVIVPFEDSVTSPFPFHIRVVGGFGEWVTNASGGVVPPICPAVPAAEVFET